MKNGIRVFFDLKNTKASDKNITNEVNSTGKIEFLLGRGTFSKENMYFA